MEKLQLAELVEDSKSIAEIAEKTNKGKSTIRHWLKKYNLKTSGRAGNKTKCTITDGKKICTKCLEIKTVDKFRERKDRPGTLQPHCLSCSSNTTIKRQQGIKKSCVDYKGGKCTDCGLIATNNNLGAFEFHHLEPAHKDFNLSDVKNRNYSSVLSELDKCVLLCSNCHVKRHLEMKCEEGYHNKLEGNTERFRDIRSQKLDYACNGNPKCSQCGYDDCESALIISYADGDKKYNKYNRMRENWDEDFTTALKNATILCKNCFRSI